MKRRLGGLLTALVLANAAAHAQGYSETTTTRSLTIPEVTAVPPALAAPAQPAVPPDGTLSTTRTTRSIDGMGNVTESQATTYRNSHGVAEDSETRTRTLTPVPLTTTTTTTTQSSTSTSR